MKLYYTAGVCSLGIHVLLEEAGLTYELQAVDLRGGEQYRPAYLAINPKSKVPVLELDDGEILTEWAAIATWLGVTNMGAGLLPMDALLIARIMEAVSYCNGTIHLQGFARFVWPAAFAASGQDQAAVKAKGIQIMEDGLALMARSLGDKDYIAGEFSLADAALFYVTFWAVTRVKLELPPAIAAHYARMLARPAVQKVMQAEGLT